MRSVHPPVCSARVRGIGHGYTRAPALPGPWQIAPRAHPLSFFPSGPACPIFLAQRRNSSPGSLLYARPLKGVLRCPSPSPSPSPPPGGSCSRNGTRGTTQAFLLMIFTACLPPFWDSLVSFSPARRRRTCLLLLLLLLLLLSPKKREREREETKSQGGGGGRKDTGASLRGASLGLQLHLQKSEARGGRG